MDLITFVIIGMVVMILAGCLFLGNIDKIGDYFSSTSITDYGKYKINLIDDIDIKYIKLLLSSTNGYQQSKDVLNKIATKILSEDDKVIFPNGLMTDDQLMGANDRYMGNELPWDKEVGQCDVLKNMDIDLYKNVQDSKTITFW